MGTPKMSLYIVVKVSTKKNFCDTRLGFENYFCWRIKNFKLSSLVSCELQVVLISSIFFIARFWSSFEREKNGRKKQNSQFTGDKKRKLDICMKSDVLSQGKNTFQEFSKGIFSKIVGSNGCSSNFYRRDLHNDIKMGDPMRFLPVEFLG